MNGQQIESKNYCDFVIPVRLWIPNTFIPAEVDCKVVNYWVYVLEIVGINMDGEFSIRWSRESKQIKCLELLIFVKNHEFFVFLALVDD